MDEEFHAPFETICKVYIGRSDLQILIKNGGDMI